MNYESKTVFGLFDGSKQYSIPLYQRAYAWKEENWKTFYNDLVEATKGQNPYFYGNILLETIEQDQKYAIIDGQQRKFQFAPCQNPDKIKISNKLIQVLTVPFLFPPNGK